jgi:hypothetical protein
MVARRINKRNRVSINGGTVSNGNSGKIVVLHETSCSSTALSQQPCLPLPSSKRGVAPGETTTILFRKLSSRNRNQSSTTPNSYCLTSLPVGSPTIAMRWWKVSSNVYASPSNSFVQQMKEPSNMVPFR